MTSDTFYELKIYIFLLDNKAYIYWSVAIIWTTELSSVINSYKDDLTINYFS
jgi:hypothetical protein